MKPLGIKAYGSIGHLPTSRLGPGDHHIPPGQAFICTSVARDKHDFIVVQEKVDGSCCSVAKLNGGILALGRSGYLAQTSTYRQHQLFAAWVRAKEERFFNLLREGERVVGEWLLQAHGTRYALPHEPFVAFDLMIGHKRALAHQVSERCQAVGIVTPRLIHQGCPASVEEVIACLEPSGHGALDPVEGAIWRVERKGGVDFLAKWLRPDKVDGCFLPEMTEAEPIWNVDPSTLLQ